MAATTSVVRYDPQDTSRLGLFDLTRTHIELYARELEDLGRKPATIGRRLCIARRPENDDGVGPCPPFPGPPRHLHIVATFVAGSSRGATTHHR